jgi:hypothetical protein
MKKLVYCGCGSTSTPHKWRAQGWLKMEIRYYNGSRKVLYTCTACRDRNIAEWEAEQKAKNATSP